MKINFKKQLINFFVLFSFVFCINASAQQLIKVSQFAWLELSVDERELIQKIHVVDLLDQERYGIIIDNQGVNESTGGTVGGANLGGAIANAAYIDNAIKGGNYSAKNQLAAGIIGALLGSTLDSKTVSQYHFRYAVKLGNGNIKYFDEIKGDPFRHPVGVCTFVPNIGPIDQQLCGQNGASLRSIYLSDKVKQVASVQTELSVASGRVADSGNVSNDNNSLSQVNCKLGTLAPVRTSAEKCELIKGSQVR